MITTFTRTSNGGPIGINAAHVKSVSQDGKTVLIRFSEAHSVGVEGELQEVINQINSAQR
ncbi:hypothetical protein [Sphingomonas sp. NFX23]|uniref:hypothetical protein n=1 Tax=Sphingomonas sp. NFX23 TaxID=2819532 RepID=UPI003CF82A8D